MSLANGNKSRYYLTVRERRSLKAHQNLANEDFNLFDDRLHAICW